MMPMSATARLGPSLIPSPIWFETGSSGSELAASNTYHCYFVTLLLQSMNMPQLLPRTDTGVHDFDIQLGYFALRFLFVIASEL